jgi:hydrogenase expression/formation protein HypE
VREEVRGACELLGLDPLYVANEGKLVAIVAREDAGEVLAAMRRNPRWRQRRRLSARLDEGAVRVW